MPTQDDFTQNPHAVFHAMRAQSPVLWSELGSTEGWMVTGFAELEAVFKDPRFVRDRSQFLPPGQLPDLPESLRPVFAMMYGMFLFRDAPYHTRIRALVTKAFTPAIVARLRPAVEAITTELVDGCAGSREHDLIGSLAYPLPVRVIAELLGAPASDSIRFREWSGQLVRIIDFQASPQDWAEAGPSVLEFKQYLDGLMEEKRAHPQPDLLSALVAASDQGNKLSPEEIASTCMLLLSAGHETTTNLLANGFYTLLRHPEQYEVLRQNMDLIPSAIEEMLRFEPPVMVTARSVGEDLEFGGRTMRRGQLVYMALAAGNRDPRVFPDPDRFDIRRSPNRHLSFAAGPHYCIGTALARLEADVALRTLITRMRQPEVIETPRWRSSMHMHGLENLRVRAAVV